MIIEIPQNWYQNTGIKSKIWKVTFWTPYGAKPLELPDFSHFLSKSKSKNKNSPADIASLKYTVLQSNLFKNFVSKRNLEFFFGFFKNEDTI